MLPMHSINVRVKYINSSVKEGNNGVSIKVVDGRSGFSAFGDVLKDHKNLCYKVRDITLHGHFKMSQKYGWQFDCSAVQLVQTGDLLTFLVDVCNIGKTVAHNIVQRLGNDLPTVLCENPEILRSIRSVSKNKLEIIVTSWNANYPLQMLSEFLMPLGV